MCPWVTRIFSTVIPAFSMPCLRRGRSPPGSTSTPRIVLVHHRNEQFCSKAVTGTIAARSGMVWVSLMASGDGALGLRNQWLIVGSQAPALPHYPTNHLDLFRCQFDRAIGRILAFQHDPPRHAGLHPLDHQRIADADHVDAIAQGTRGAVDQDLVAVAQERLHRVARDEDGRKLARLEALLTQPGGREAQGAHRLVPAGKSAGPGRSLDREARNIEPAILAGAFTSQGIDWGGGIILRRAEIRFLHAEEFGEPTT